MQKKKIMIFMISLGGGGVQRFVMNLISKLNKEKFDLCIALVNKSGVYLNHLPQDVRIIDLKAKRVHISLIPLIKNLKKEQPDILFSVDTSINIVRVLDNLII